MEGRPEHKSHTEDVSLEDRNSLRQKVAVSPEGELVKKQEMAEDQRYCETAGCHDLGLETQIGE